MPATYHARPSCGKTHTGKSRRWEQKGEDSPVLTLASAGFSISGGLLWISSVTLAVSCGQGVCLKLWTAKTHTHFQSSMLLEQTLLKKKIKLTCARFALVDPKDDGAMVQHSSCEERWSQGLLEPDRLHWAGPWPAISADMRQTTGDTDHAPTVWLGSVSWTQLKLTPPVCRWEAYYPPPRVVQEPLSKRVNLNTCSTGGVQ